MISTPRFRDVPNLKPSKVSFSQAGSYVDEWYNTVLKQLVLCGYPQETMSIQSRDIFLLGLQDQYLLATCMSEATTDWSGAKIWQIAKQLESRRAAVKHMKNSSTSQSQPQVNQLRNQKVSFAQYRKKEKEESFILERAISSFFKPETAIQQVTTNQNSFKPLQAHVTPQYQGCNLFKVW